MKNDSQSCGKLLTPRAQRVIGLAAAESDKYHSDYIGTAHILLGIIEDGDGIAVRALENLGITKAKLRAEIESIIGSERPRPMGG